MTKKPAPTRGRTDKKQEEAPPPKADAKMEALARDVEKTNPEFIEHLRSRGLLKGKK